MYPSDFGYGVLKSNCRRSTFLSSYDNQNCVGENWLYDEGNEWTITPSSINNNYVFASFFYGNYGSKYSTTKSYMSSVARPVLYLDPNVYVLDGDGSISDPYIIGM